MSGRPSFLKQLGLTGSIGAGKSTAAALLCEAGLTVLDADAMAREVTAAPAVLAEIAARWPEVVGEGRLDRAALAARVFADPAELAALEAITHPRIAERAAEELSAAAERGEGWVVRDIPLLFEKGLQPEMDAVWVVDAPYELRLARLAARSGLTPEQVAAREAAQWPAQRKRAAADLVLDNSGTVEGLRAQIAAALARL